MDHCRSGDKSRLAVADSAKAEKLDASFAVDCEVLGFANGSCSLGCPEHPALLLVEFPVRLVVHGKDPSNCDCPCPSSANTGSFSRGVTNTFVEDRENVPYPFTKGRNESSVRRTETWNQPPPNSQQMPLPVMSLMTKTN